MLNHLHLLLFLTAMPVMVMSQLNPDPNDEYVYDQVDESEDDDYTPIVSEGKNKLVKIYQFLVRKYFFMRI